MGGGSELRKIMEWEERELFRNEGGGRERVETGQIRTCWGREGGIGGKRKFNARKRKKGKEGGS